MAYTYVGSTFGALFVSILNTLMPWRMVAFACIFVPILTLIILLFVSNSKKFRIFLRILRTSSSFFSFFRFQNHHYGCYQKIDHFKLIIRFVGYEVGLQKKPHSMNSKHFNATTIVQNRVVPASNGISCVLIH